ncbi:MAG TPA: thioredoxin domain-containing protein [Bacteroidota bacterium]|nr:thioredoxin domain-containing protein [Bacteroidota bacterium]
MSSSANRLVGEKSPYLLQHAHNPVDWYPWGEEAFARARTRDVPVFLSVGYATCHWCHVMERESFEDPAIAALLNESFVCIKVDREERPDVDRLYMTALQAMGQNGGWPMSMFLTPAGRPFYGGTYFPPHSRQGRAGFPDVIRRIRHIWDTERSRVEESAGSVTTFLEDVAASGAPGVLPGPDVLESCYRQFASSYDPAHGGFGAGPKFPRPVVLDFLLRYHRRSSLPQARDMVIRTLRAMASGGMYDHLGGGFHRYAVDREWRVPHFEKMLYDQAQLAAVYLDAYTLTGQSWLATVARETLDYVLRDMTFADGGFFSAEDADSPRHSAGGEQGEGAFYVWRKQEIDGLLGDDALVFNDHFGVLEGGNVPFDPAGEFAGLNILYRPGAAGDALRPVPVSEPRIETAKQKLFAARAARPRPLRDDKILTSWNGLMIGACARGARVLGDGRYLIAAERAADFILDRLYDGARGRLLRRFRDGESRIDGGLDDYAFFVAGLIELFEASGRGRWLSLAVRLIEEQVRLFHDPAHGGFFDTAGEDAILPVRIKEQYDGAEPSGNSVAALNLCRLARTIDRPQWEELASETVAGFSATLTSQPGVLPLMGAALDALLEPPRQVVIAGSAADERTSALRRTVYGRYTPAVSIVPLDPEEPEPRRLNRFFESMRLVGGKPAAYVCRNFSCELPVTEPGDLANLLDGPR